MTSLSLLAGTTVAEENGFSLALMETLKTGFVLLRPYYAAQVQIKKKFESKIVNIFLTTRLNICFGSSKEPSH